MLNNGTYGKSHVEDVFFSQLCKKYANVQRQVRINGWDIDFYIPEIETYIQLDGVYWHGLDRDERVIAEYTFPRDRTIHQTMFRDKRQNMWFSEQGLRLIRFTDKQVKDGVRLQDGDQNQL